MIASHLIESELSSAHAPALYGSERTLVHAEDLKNNHYAERLGAQGDELRPLAISVMGKRGPSARKYLDQAIKAIADVDLPIPDPLSWTAASERIRQYQTLSVAFWRAQSRAMLVQFSDFRDLCAAYHMSGAPASA